MLDERVRAVLARLEQEDAAERAAGLPAKDRSRQVEPTTGRFLFALAACQAGIEVLEVGGSRGYSSIWLAAGARVLGGRLTSLESDSAKCAAWRANVAEAGLDEWAELIEGDAHAALAASQDTFDLVFLDAEKDDYEALFAPRAAAARAGRARRRRQRALARRDPRCVLGVAPGGSDALERHRPARPRPRAVGRRSALLPDPVARGRPASGRRGSSARHPPSLHPLAVRMLALPRKGGGPA